MRTLSLNQDSTPKLKNRYEKIATMIVGNHRDQAEQHDQPDLQPRAGEAAPALGPDLDQPLRDQRAERQQQDEVEVEQREDGVRMRPERRRPGQRQIGRDPRAERRDRQAIASLRRRPMRPAQLRTRRISLMRQPRPATARQRKRLARRLVTRAARAAAGRSASSQPGAILGRGRPGCPIRGFSCATCCG